MTVHEIAQRPTAVFRRLLLSLALALAVGGVVPAAHAQNYTFTIIASGVKEFSAPAINAAGMVTFIENPGGSAPKVMRGDGGPLVTIATLTESPPIGPALDATGSVIFEHPDGRIVAGNGGPLTTLVAPGADIEFGAGFGTCDVVRLAGRTVSAIGEFAVMCSFADAPSLGKTGLYKRDGLSLTRICDEGLDANNFQAFPFCGTNSLVGTSSDARHAFVAFPLDAALTWQSAIAVDALSGLHEVLLNTDPPGFGFQQVAINDSGTIAFSGGRTGDSNTSIFVTTTSGLQQVTPLAPAGAAGFLAAITPSINNAGTLVFEAAVRTLSGNEVNGVYTGSDPLVDRIIQTGEPFLPLGGATVQRVVVGNPGINDAGQIVFVIGLGLGFNAVVRADPVNRLPVVVNPGNQSTPEGSPVTLQIVASDPDNDLPLTYLSSAPTPLPAGTLAGPPPGISAIDQSGRFVGTPDPGTAGNTYAVTVSVRDSRGALSVPETFTWTITPPAPAQRTGLTANFVLAEEMIRLAWQNPTPDTAQTIEVQFAEGACGGTGFTHLTTLAAGTTSLEWVHGTPGQAYRFRVVGISAAGVRSTPSNVACATMLGNQISNVQVTALSDTTATITWTTLMRSHSVPTLSPMPAGLVANLSSPDQKTFTLALSGLVPQTAYSLRILASSLLRGHAAVVEVPFTTALPPTVTLLAEVVGALRIGGAAGRYEDSYERNGVRHAVQVTVKNVEVDVRISNATEQPVTIDDLVVTAATTLDLPCPPLSNLCRSSFRTYPTTEPATSGGLLSVLDIRPAQLGTLAPGEASQTVTVTFRVDDYVLEGLRGSFGGSGVITTDLTYSTRTVAGPQPGHSRPSTRVLFPGTAADLILELTGTASVPLLPGGVVTYTAVVRNDGPATATAVTVGAAVPPGTTLTGFDGQHWRCRVTSGQVITCDSIANIAPGAASGPLSFTVRLDAISLSTVTLTAAVRGAQDDPDPVNNVASVVTAAGPVAGPGADIGLTALGQEVLDEPPFPLYLFSFEVENRGPDTAVGVVLSIRLEDPALRFAVPLPCEQNAVGALLVCALGDIAPGERIPKALFLVSTRPGLQPFTVAVAAVTSDPDPSGLAGGLGNVISVGVVHTVGRSR